MRRKRCAITSAVARRGLSSASVDGVARSPPLRFAALWRMTVRLSGETRPERREFKVGCARFGG